MNIYNHEKEKQRHYSKCACLWLLAQNLPWWNFYKQQLSKYYKNIPEILSDINCHKILNTAKSNEYLQSWEKTTQFKTTRHDTKYSTIKHFYKQGLFRFFTNTPELHRVILIKILQKAKSNECLQSWQKIIIQKVPVFGFLYKIYQDKTFIKSSYRDIIKIFTVNKRQI